MLTRKKIEKLWAEGHGHATPAPTEKPVERFARLIEARVLENVIKNSTYDSVDDWGIPVLGKEQILTAARKARRAAGEGTA